MYYSLSDGEQKPHLGYDYYFAKVQTDSKLLTPCWSLAALLDILPTLDERNPVLCKNIHFDMWHILYHETASLELIETGLYAYPVDACYEIILKLYEQKLYDFRKKSIAF